MKKDLEAPKYKIGDVVSFHQDDDYRVSRISGIVYYDGEYKYLFDEDIISDTEIDIRLLVSEESIENKLN